MRKLISMLKRFFLPPEGTPIWQRILPYAVLGFLPYNATGIYLLSYIASRQG